MSWAAALTRDLSSLLDTKVLSSCGSEVVNRLQAVVRDVTNKESLVELDALIDLAYTKMSASPRHSNPLCWRRLYAEACLFRSLADIQTHDTVGEPLALSAVSRLDRAIVISGAPGRLDLVHAVIAKIQLQFLPAASPPSSFSSSFPISSARIDPLVTAAHCIPCLANAPSMAAFQSQLSRQPFILRGYLHDWPATNEHPWRSPDYLRHVSGRGRIVPVEVGADYRENNWSQQMMNWDDFLGAICSQSDRQMLYLAQHNLLQQFPALRSDIIIPDYVYTSPPPDYSPPANEDQLVLNAWLGPRGTLSPAHTDPFYNFYAQVVGRKTVWLAPPSVSSSMYPYAPPEEASCHVHNPAANNVSPSMSNTSRVDVFVSTRQHQEFPLFWEHVVPRAMKATLEPGDVLFFPPGWWHAMRSEDISFSVSMWF